MELLPSSDLIEVKNLVEKENFSSFTFTEGPVRTDEPSKSLLGSFYDPVFGITTINFATQFRLLDIPDFGTNPVADSIKLYLYYRVVYGDTVTPQTFKVYELQEPVYSDTTNATGGSYDYPYYQDVDLKALTSGFLLGQITTTPVVRQDSATRDTFYQQLSIPLDVSLGQRLVNATGQQMANNDVFLEFFKGLYIESEKQNSPGGSVITLEAVYSNTWQGSALAVFYKNDEFSNIDTTLFYPYLISPFSARVNSIDHDYSVTAFGANLNMETQEDSLIYVQPTGGLKSKIINNELSSWRDSSNIAINKAEIVFQIDTLASELEKYPPPSQLLFTFINAESEEDLPADYWFDPLFFNGFLNTSDYTYRFNITQHLQRIIDGQVQNDGFFLTTAIKSSQANRVVLKGSTSHTGIRLIVTYSKFLQ
jgi:hypothetical protein